MTDIVMTAYPRTRQAQLKFDKCKTGDTVWFTGGYTIAGDWRSFGRRAKVVDVRADGPKGGVRLKPDNDPSEVYHVTHLITREDILATLAQRETPEAQNEFLGNFQLKPGDLDTVAKPAKKPTTLEAMTKAELIERVKALETELANLKASLEEPA